MQAVHLLKTVGLSEYEAKAYTALLAQGEPMNGYEVAKSSGVPRSTIYEVLAKLVARGAAVQVHGVGRSTESFAAVQVEAFIDRYRNKMASTLDGLADALPRVAAKSRSYLVQKLQGREAIVDRMNDVLAVAQSHVWLSIWPDVSPGLVRSARARSRAGVDVTTVAFGHIDPFPGLVQQHVYLSPEVTEQRLGCRLYLAVADHQQVVIACAEGSDWRGMWSDDMGVALLAAEHVRFDITIQILCTYMASIEDYEALSSDPTLNFLGQSMESGIAQLIDKMSEA
jgi:HTH-type transcriptional regulator, sugar sensing transcriptional regulator